MAPRGMICGAGVIILAWARALAPGGPASFGNGKKTLGKRALSNEGGGKGLPALMDSASSALFRGKPGGIVGAGKGALPGRV